MVLPHKLHPYGNYYHSIADGGQDKPLMWRVELVEGKDHPMQLDKLKWAEMGKQWASCCE